MSDTTTKVREHYDGTGLIDRIKAVLETITAEDEPLTVSLLASADQFHVQPTPLPWTAFSVVIAPGSALVDGAVVGAAEPVNLCTHADRHGCRCLVRRLDSSAPSDRRYGVSHTVAASHRVLEETMLC
jgi:hypothetical protein